MICKKTRQLHRIFLFNPHLNKYFLSCKVIRKAAEAAKKNTGSNKKRLLE